MNTYYKAAKFIANGKEEFSCVAILRYSPSLFKPLQQYTKLFQPTYTEYVEFNSGGYGWFGTYNNPENQLARSLALLFMHEMEKECIS